MGSLICMREGMRTSRFIWKEFCPEFDDSSLFSFTFPIDMAMVSHISGQIHPHYWWLSNNSCWTNSYVWRLIPDSNPKSLGIPWKNVHFFTSSYPFKNIPKRARNFRRKSSFAPWSHPIILLWKRALSGSCPEMWLKGGEMGILVWKMSPKSGVKQWITGFILNPQWGEDCPWLVVAKVFKEINAGWWYTYPPE
jgi:hypothetical protein